MNELQTLHRERQKKLLLYKRTELEIQEKQKQARVDELERNELFRTISLENYTKEFWSVLEPTNPFVNGWEVGCLCEYLTACYDRQIRNLIINISPRSLKSTICSVNFPSWVWTKNSTERFITTSYAQNLALRDATKARTVIESPRYKQHYGNIFSLEGD